MDRHELLWQRSLFSATEPAFDVAFTAVRRIQLHASAWLEHAPTWVSGSDTLFERVLAARRWGQRTRHLYDHDVLEPRLTAQWSLGAEAPLEPAILERMRQALSARYGRTLDSVGFNLYRDGDDSVAWHGDKLRREIEEPIVALVSLGEPRRFLLRPKGGGASIAFQLGHGALLVTGGTTQRTWEHSVPKVKKAGPRISIAFRHGLDVGEYDREVAPPAAGP